MNILKLIRARKAIRKYKNKQIPKKVIDKIIASGRWGPSIHQFQPWKFLVIEKSNLIQNISKIVTIKLKEKNIPGFLYYPTIRSLAGTKLIICIYNTQSFTNFIKKFQKTDINIATMTEISAISAAIQNMILTAESLGIGTCWLTAPLLCRKEINKLVNVQDKLVAILTFGYPIGKGKRSPRKPFSEIVKYII